MRLVKNGFFGKGLNIEALDNIPYPSINADLPLGLLAECPRHAETPLLNMEALAIEAGVGHLFVKDETNRMGLGSFKALGAAYVIAHHATQSGCGDDLSTALAGRTYITASAGNHGLSVAAGARVFGARAIIYLSQTVPDAFADRLRAKGAQVRVEGADYEASMKAAVRAAEAENLILLSDTSWEGYTELPHRLMEGYLASAHEATICMDAPPSHIFLQAGVGGLAVAMACYFRKAWGESPIITIVEPVAAPALQASIEAGKPVFSDGPVSNMGRLDCKEPSLIALKGLARDANFFLTISDELASEVTGKLASHGLRSTPSGVAGLAGLFACSDLNELKPGPNARVLCIVSEGAEA